MMNKGKCDICKKPMLIGVDKATGNLRDPPYLCSRKQCKQTRDKK